MEEKCVVIFNNFLVPNHPCPNHGQNHQRLNAFSHGFWINLVLVVGKYSKITGGWPYPREYGKHSRIKAVIKADVKFSKEIFLSLLSFRYHHLPLTKGLLLFCSQEDVATSSHLKREWLREKASNGHRCWVINFDPKRLQRNVRPDDTKDCQTEFASLAKGRRKRMKTRVDWVNGQDKMRRRGWINNTTCWITTKSGPIWIDSQSIRAPDIIVEGTDDPTDQLKERVSDVETAAADEANFFNRQTDCCIILISFSSGLSSTIFGITERIGVGLWSSRAVWTALDFLLRGLALLSCANQMLDISQSARHPADANNGPGINRRHWTGHMQWKREIDGDPF